MIRYRSGPTGTPTEVAFGTDLHYWIDDAPLFVAIAFDHSSSPKKLRFAASLGGDEVRTHSIDNPFSTTSPPMFTDLYFRAGPGAATPDEVVEFRWFGGDVDTSPVSAPTETTLKAAFETLGFLT